MGDWKYRFADLVERTSAGGPTENAYSAMAVLLAGRFLQLTGRERAKQVHLGPSCRPCCGLCEDIALRHSQWATDKLHKHLRSGPPRTRGVVIRDWETILTWTTSPRAKDLEVAAVRHALQSRLPADHPLLPLVLALSTQLLPVVGDARAPRRTRDYVGDPRKSVLAQRHGWAVKPERDLREAHSFAALRSRHERGVDLLLAVLKQLDYGDDDPYWTVLSRPETRRGDQSALRALIAELLGEQWTRKWFLINVEARHSYNEDLRRRAYRYAAAVDLLTEDSMLPGGIASHDEQGRPDGPFDTLR